MEKNILVLDTNSFWSQFLKILYPSSSIMLANSLMQAQTILYQHPIDCLICPAQCIPLFISLLLDVRQISPGTSVILIGKDVMQLSSSKMSTMRHCHFNIQEFNNTLSELMSF
jgi:hypothetical protein